jgi:uncharacterized membrane protein YphA (DoxX/SURF4 family)
MTKTKKIISWVLAALIALGFLFAGITKLLGTEMQIKNLASWGYPLWFRFPIGLAEVIFAVTILIPKYRKFTIYGIFIWTVVAVITHLQASQAAMIGAPILFAILAGVILLLERKKTGYTKSFAA